MSSSQQLSATPSATYHGLPANRPHLRKVTFSDRVASQRAHTIFRDYGSLSAIPHAQSRASSNTQYITYSTKPRIGNSTVRLVVEKHLLTGNLVAIRSLVLDGSLRKALDGINLLEELHPHNYEILQLKAEILAKLGHYSRSLTLLNYILAHKPADLPALHLRNAVTHRLRV